MKKKLLTIISTIVLILTLSVTVSAYTVGDINSDNNINAQDALMILKHAAKIESLSNDISKYADIDWDGNINATDALAVLKHAAKIETLPDSNPYFYDLAENNGFMMNKLPYTSNGVTINSISVNQYGYLEVIVTNNTGKAIGDYSYFNVKFYNVDNEMIRESSFSIPELDAGESGRATVSLTDNTYKIVFTYPKLYEGRSSSGIETVVNGDIVTNKFPFSIDGININSYQIDKYDCVTLNVTNNTGKALKASSYIYYKLYDENGYVTRSSIKSLKDINSGQSCSITFYLDDDTKKFIIYATDLDFDTNLSNLQMETYDGISVNKLPYTDANKLTINSIDFEDDNIVKLIVTNNTGKAVTGSSYITYKCINGSGTVVKNNSIFLCNMNSGEKCKIQFTKTADTAEIIFYESKVYEGNAIASVTTSVYNGITANKTPANMSNLNVESISFEDSRAYVTVKNNTGKVVNDGSYINYRCIDSNGVIIQDGAFNVQHMNSGEKCKKDFGIPEDTSKVILYAAKIYEGTASPSVATSNYSGIAMNSVPFSSNGLKISSYTIDDYSIKVSVTNETGNAISGSSNISYKCYDNNGIVISSGSMYLNNMNAGDTYVSRISRKDGVAKIVFYEFTVK